MFELSFQEYDALRSQFGTLKRGEHSKYVPMAFTEQGVAMLSSVLNSPTAIDVNIQIIRVFTKMRELILTHKDILIKLEQIEKKLIKQDARTDKHEEEIQTIFKALKKLITPPPNQDPASAFAEKTKKINHKPPPPPPQKIPKPLRRHSNRTIHSISSGNTKCQVGRKTIALLVITAKIYHTGSLRPGSTDVQLSILIEITNRKTIHRTPRITKRNHRITTTRPVIKEHG